jgi:AcrR family transcriptional regulator
MRNAPNTKAAILAAAREQFALLGFDRATVRGVAQAAGCDPALAYRYFGSKKALFVAAVSIDLQLPDLATLPRADVTPALLQHFFRVWEDDATFIGLLRASAQSEEAADAMRLFFVQGILPRLGAVVQDASPQRAALAGSMVIGLAWSRYVLKNPLMAALSRDELISLVQPALDAALFGT